MAKLSDTFLHLLGDTLDAVPPEERAKIAQNQQMQDTNRLTALAHLGSVYDVGPAEQGPNMPGSAPVDAGIPVPGMSGYSAKPKRAEKGTWKPNLMSGGYDWYSTNGPGLKPPSTRPASPSSTDGSETDDPLAGLPFKDRAKLLKEKPKAEGSLQTTLHEYDNMINAASAIRDDPSLAWATGMATPLGSVPGTGARRVAANLETLKSKTLLSVLSSLKQLSTNGASGFGALSNVEGEQIRNSISSLDRAQNTGDFKSSLDRFINEIQSRKDILNTTFKNTYGKSPAFIGHIRVRNKLTGQTGQIPQNNFDPSKYDQL